VEREAKKGFATARKLLTSGPVPKRFAPQWHDLLDLVERRKN
jgi:hypothetical protein